MAVDLRVTGGRPGPLDQNNNAGLDLSLPKEEVGGGG